MNRRTGEKLIDPIGEAGPLSLATVYHEYRGLVRAVIFRIAGADELDDLVQETFVRIWKGLENFRRQSNVKTWIYRIAVNTALDACRRNRRKRYEKELPAETVGEDASREQTLRNLFQVGLAGLSDEHRTVLVLECIDGLSIQEISDVLGVWQGTVKSRLFYARKAMLRFLEDQGVNV